MDDLFFGIQGSDIIILPLVPCIIHLLSRFELILTFISILILLSYSIFASAYLSTPVSANKIFLFTNLNKSMSLQNNIKKLIG